MLLKKHDYHSINLIGISNTFDNFSLRMKQESWYLDPKHLS